VVVPEAYVCSVDLYKNYVSRVQEKGARRAGFVDKVDATTVATVGIPCRPSARKCAIW
jgi:hypothetical protein